MNDNNIIAAVLTVALRVARPLSPPATDGDWHTIFQDYENFLSALANKTADEMPARSKATLEQVKELRKKRGA